MNDSEKESTRNSAVKEQENKVLLEERGNFTVESEGFGNAVRRTKPRYSQAYKIWIVREVEKA